MQTLINKLSKQDQKIMKMALIHAKNGNYNVIDSMIRSANSRSLPILTQIRKAL